MKTKISKILGVALTTVLLASMLVFTLPTSADPGDVVWENVPTPAIAPCFTLDAVASALGPIEQNCDGTIFYAQDTSTAPLVLLASTDCGRCWAPTTYNFGAIVAIAASDTEPNTVFVATAKEVYRSDNAGLTWINVAVSPITGVTNITALDCATLSAGRYLLCSGATDPTAVPPVTAEVYTLDTGGTFPPVWVDTDFYQQTAIDFPGAQISSVQAVAITPNSSETRGFVAIGNDLTANQSYISVKIGGARWGGDIGQLVAGSLPINAAPGPLTAAIAFPDGFSWANCFFYFGIGSPADAQAGVYSFWGQPFPLNSFIAPNIIGAGTNVVSLDCSGTFGLGLVVAGLQAPLGGTPVLRSLDGGANWIPGPVKPPAGAGFAYVFINDSTACAGWYALVDGANGGLSLSLDNGTSWNGISFVLNPITNITDLTFLADGTLLMASNDVLGTGIYDIWRLSAAGVWERVFTSTIAGANFDMVEAVPASNTFAFLALFGGGAQRLWRTTDAGQTWAQQANNVPLVGTLSTWLIVSDLKQVVGDSAGNVYITNFNGISWGGAIATGLGANAVYSMALDATDNNRMLVGGSNGAVFLSTTGGTTWATAGPTGLATSVYVSFDASDPTVFYGAFRGGQVRRGPTVGLVNWTQIDLQGQDLNVGFAGGEEFGIEAAAGIASSVIAPLYVTDSTAPQTPTTALRARGAMYRALDPTATVSAIFVTPYWENAYEATPAGTLALATVTFGVLNGTSNLWLIPGAGDIPTLWAVDTSGADGLWKYTDTLASASTLAAGTSGSETDTFAWDVDFTTTTANISWSALLGATSYQLQVNSRPDWNPATDVATIVSYFPDASAVVTGLLPGTQYWVRVRAATQTAVGIAGINPFTPAGIGAPVRSPWSPTMTFTTQLGQATPPLPLVPLPGAQNVILNPTFDWDPVPGASSYTIVVATDPDFSNVVCSGSPTTDYWECDTTLECYTHYYWSVSPVDSAGAPAGDPIYSVFTTEDCAAIPVYIWIIIAIGAVLVIVVIYLIFATRAK
jgi:photosystem II stability/assembly factor-like uncharacterized protein